MADLVAERDLAATLAQFAIMAVQVAPEIPAARAILGLHEIEERVRAPVLVATKDSVEIKVSGEPETTARFIKVEPMINLHEADRLPIEDLTIWPFGKTAVQMLWHQRLLESSNQLRSNQEREEKMRLDTPSALRTMAGEPDIAITTTIGMTACSGTPITASRHLVAQTLSSLRGTRTRSFLATSTVSTSM